jgi:hypothetical protein
MGRRSRTTVVAGTVALMFGASASFGAASAAAVTGTECGGTVRGAPGESVSVNPDSLLGLGPDRLVNVGTVPSSGSRTIDVTGALSGLLGPLAPGCSIVAQATEPVEKAAEPVVKAAEPVVKAVEDATGQQLPGSPAPERGQPTPEPERSPSGSNAPATASNAAPAPAPAPQFGPFLPLSFDVGPAQQGVYNFSSLSLYDYRKLFGVTPGQFGQLPSSNLFGGSELFGPTPQFGILGADSAAAKDVAAAGRAEALPTASADRVALPVLVAVLALSGVTAALARSWILRPKKR